MQSRAFLSQLSVTGDESGFFMSFRKGMKKASHPAKQQIESSQLDNEGNDIDAVVEQINVSLVTIFLSNLSFCYEKMLFV